MVESVSFPRALMHITCISKGNAIFHPCLVRTPAQHIQRLCAYDELASSRSLAERTQGRRTGYHILCSRKLGKTLTQALWDSALASSTSSAPSFGNPSDTPSLNAAGKLNSERSNMCAKRGVTTAKAFRMRQWSC